MVFAPRFSPDGSRVLTASDRVARIWDLASGRDLISLEGHAASIEWATFSRDGQEVFTASSDHTARAWHIAHAPVLPLLSGDQERIRIDIYVRDNIP